LNKPDEKMPATIDWRRVSEPNPGFASGCCASVKPAKQMLPASLNVNQWFYFCRTQVNLRLTEGFMSINVSPLMENFLLTSVPQIEGIVLAIRL